MVQNQAGLFLVCFCQQPHFHVHLFLQLRPPSFRLERPYSGSVCRSQPVQKTQTRASARCIELFCAFGSYFFIFTLQCLFGHKKSPAFQQGTKNLLSVPGQLDPKWNSIYTKTPPVVLLGGVEVPILVWLKLFALLWYTIYKSAIITLSYRSLHTLFTGVCKCMAWESAWMAFKRSAVRSRLSPPKNPTA